MPIGSDVTGLVGRLAAFLGATTLFVLAAQAFALARRHMALIGDICGAAPETLHCAWCFVAAGLALAGLAALIFALRPTAMRLSLSAAARKA
jgi:hypothetical protein